jgi:hypothetical protein
VIAAALSAAALAAALLLLGEGYVLIGRAQRLLDRIEPAADALDLLLPRVPGKSAVRDRPQPGVRDTAEIGAVLEDGVRARGAHRMPR